MTSTLTTTDLTSAPATTTTSLWRTGARAGAVAAVATTAVAAAAQAVDIPLEVAGGEIPLLGFAQLTLICTAIGVLLTAAARRWAARPRTAFVRTTVALTALSLVPDLTADATTATIVVLLLTHLVAAAIVIPRLSARLEG